MDNLSGHKVAGIRDAIESVGARMLYVPPDRPDFNPIETVFSKFQWLLKRATDRTVETLWDRCGRLPGAVTEAECRRHFRHAGCRYE